MTINFRYSEEFWVVVIALLSALLLAANENAVGGVTKLMNNYFYWMTRILIEATLFIAVLYTMEKIIAQKVTRLWVYAAAIVLSLLPFTLAIISFDLILGLPELGLNEGNNLITSHLLEFGLELIFLLDNHLALCALLLLPRFLSLKLARKELEGVSEKKASQLFFDTLEPPLEGHIYHIEAQEHYVRVTTAHESRMVLCRFSDAIREMPKTQGLQVHRSHWVAYVAVKGLIKDGQNLKLKLFENGAVPVSRSFRTQVEKKFLITE